METWIKPQAAASILHVHPETLRRYVKRGIIPQKALYKTPTGRLLYDQVFIQNFAVANKNAQQEFRQRLQEYLDHGGNLLFILNQCIDDVRFINIVADIEKMKACVNRGYSAEAAYQKIMG